jgi:predicted chitinase
VPTYDQFCAGVAGYSKTTAGGNPPKPSQDIYNAYVKNVSNMSLKEQAMFLANSVWETGGLQYMKEIACSNGSCTYGKYYGRGFLQLTWDYNYKAASTAIYGNDSLYTNPDLAAQPDGAWKTAMWYWNKNVSPALKANNAVDTYKLGYAIKAINGALECPANDKAKNRLAIYNEILNQWGIAKNNPGTTAGC